MALVVMFGCSYLPRGGDDTAGTLAVHQPPGRWQDATLRKLDEVAASDWCADAAHFVDRGNFTDHVARVRDLDGGAAVRLGRQDWIERVHWSADCTAVVYVTGDERVKAWDLAPRRRLPTLAEWELAARSDATTTVARILSWYGRPLRGPLPSVGSTAAQANGVWDLHGLVWEWVNDFNTALVTGESRADAGLDGNLFCGSGALGASSFDDYAAFMRYAFRSSLKAHYTVPNLGFRCAQDHAP